MKNRFNRLTSKEWLPFQKSWFKYSDDYTLYREHIRFFCKAEITEEVLYYYGLHGQIVQEICAQENIQFVENITDTSAIQYAFLDLRHEINPEWKIEEIQSYIKQVSNIIKTVNDALIDRRFVTILLPQSSSLEKPYVPIAWLLAYSISRFLHLKDEKIACLPDVHENLQPSFSDMRNSILYCLNFRKDEAQEIRELPFQYNKLYSNISEKKSAFPSKVLEKWFILKPNPRKKNEVLHPAKFPEELVVKYVEALTNVGDNVLDPMSGTGSTQVASVKLGRNGYGTELSHFFFNIAKDRCTQVVQAYHSELFHESSPVGNFDIKEMDARDILKSNFPHCQYIFTSPPYWDMLNMKGAENQAKRVEKGLRTNYSEDTQDLGNIADYEQFVKNLASIYLQLSDLLTENGYLTIVVKNIKKKGRNYPFAWDLSAALMEKYHLLPETFWCQDDINLAPYGYGNTFVSNTFHQYCLHFQKK